MERLVSQGRVATFGLGAMLAVACGADDGASAVDDPRPEVRDPDAPAGPPSTVCRAEPALTLAAPVADARMRAPFAITVDVRDRGGMVGPHPVEVELQRAGATVKTLHSKAHEPGPLRIELDARDTAPLELGGYTIAVRVGCPAGATEASVGAATAPLWLARLGVTAVDLGDGDGERLPLLYHAVDQRYDNLYPIGDSPIATLEDPGLDAEIDDAEGKPRAFARPWDDLASPPVDATGAVVERGATLPASLRVGTRPDVRLTVGKTALGPRGVGSTFVGEPGAPEIRVALEGGPAGAGARAVPGAPSTVRLADSPVPAVGRYDREIRWRFEAKGDGGAWAEVPGAGGGVTVRLYGVLGNQQGTAAPDLPWVAVVDDATRAVGGKAADPDGVRSALVRHVYEELGLTYDRAQGASHYTAYQGTYAQATFKLAHFLARDFGSVINCSDCASILSAYANMIGAPLRYTVITSGFSLHPILGIGASTFGSPFDSGRMAFNYHAVTSPDAAARIWDATLAVDGDADAASAPHTKRLVQGMAGPEYLERLSGDVRAKYNYVDKNTRISF